MTDSKEVIDWDKVYAERPTPDLATGDLIRVPDYSTDVYLVDGLRAHGMLVDATPIQGGQQFCFPINSVTKFQPQESVSTPLLRHSPPDPMGAKPPVGTLPKPDVGSGVPPLERRDMGRDLTSGDVARIFHVAPGTVDRWADAGKIPYTRTEGRHRRFSEIAVREALNRLATQDRSGVKV